MKMLSTTIAICALLFYVQSVVAQAVPSNFNDSLPEDFTAIHAEVFSEPPTDEYIFFAFMKAWSIYPDITPYLVIADNYGTPVFYRRFTSDVMDFKLQPNGMLSYHDSELKMHILMDSAYRAIDTISYIGYPIDFHDFHILENGNYLLLGAELRLVDMDTVIEGGHQDVTVMGTNIQIQDNAENLLFEWSAWDHLLITDSYVDLLSENFIDFAHTNALEMDTDTTLLMSHRNMNEITKIDIRTGDIIWRLGGKNNEFTYTETDTLGFAGQHDIRRLPDGTYQIFDNGWNHDPHFSCALRLDLDEENKIAHVIKRVRSQPDDIYGSIMGNAQHLPNGRTMIGWGSGNPNITEFDADGNKIVEFSYEGVSYRAFKFTWETSAFSFDQDELHFEPIQPGDTTFVQLKITNHLDQDIQINRLVSRTGCFSAAGNFPVSIPAHETGTFSIRFNSDTTGLVDDVLTIGFDQNNDTLTQRIAKQIHAFGEVSEDAFVNENQQVRTIIFPNPVRTSATIKTGQTGMKNHKLVNYSGQAIWEFSTSSTTFNIDFSGMNPGIYLLITTDEQGNRHTAKIVKQ
jgi:hypothetical protein